MANFAKIKKSYTVQGKFVKSKNSSLLSFLWFSLKNDNLGLKMKILKFLGIQPNDWVHTVSELPLVNWVILL